MKISCIIPAYNEEKSIGNTLRVVTAVPDLFEIIVINDCSQDKTKKIIETFSNVKLIDNEKNIGKSKSVAKGIESSSGDYLLFLDADLLGLTPETIKSLLLPVQENHADVVISLRENTPQWLKTIVGLEIISGDRVLPAKLMRKHVKEINNLKNFGLEVFINKLIIENKLHIQSVLILGVQNDYSWTKRGFFAGMKREVLMWRDIFSVISPWGYVRQNIYMKRLLVDNK